MGYVASVLVDWLRRGLGEDEVAVLTPPGSRMPVPIWEQVLLPAACRRLRARILLCPYNTGPLYMPRETRLLLAIHDLIFLRSSREIAWSDLPRQNLGRLYRRLVVPPTARRADGLVASSRHTAEELRSRFGTSIPPARILRLPPRVSRTQPATATRLASQYKVEPPYILHIGGDAPHKNTVTVVEAFRHFARGSGDARLVVLGVRKPGLLLQGRAVPPGVHFLPFVPEPDLAGLISRARALVMASTHEGLGLPIQEALAMGTPVICSAIPPFEELAEDAARYFEPYDEADLGRAMASVLVDERMHAELSARARARGRRLEEAACAEPFLDLVRELLDVSVS